MLPEVVSWRSEVSSVGLLLTVHFAVSPGEFSLIFTFPFRRCFSPVTAPEAVTVRKSVAV